MEKVIVIGIVVCIPIAYCMFWLHKITKKRIFLNISIITGIVLLILVDIGVYILNLGLEPLTVNLEGTLKWLYVSAVIAYKYVIIGSGNIFILFILVYWIIQKKRTHEQKSQVLCE